MTNTQGSGGPPSFPSGPNPGSMPRRSSYASVVSGATPQGFTSPARSGAFAHLTNSTPSNSYPPQYQSEYRATRYFSGQDTEMHTSSAVPLPGGWRKNTPLPSYSRQFAGLPDFAMAGSSMSNQFFIPSYLRNSRYVTKLEQTHKAKVSAQRDPSSTHSSNPTSLSASSSNVNLHRMAPSHRGMTYDIIENRPSSEEEILNPLPSRWNELDKCGTLEILQDGLEVRYAGPVNKHEHEAAAIRTDHPMPPQCGIYYFEVTILSKSKDGMIGVGFSSSKASLERLPGWEQESWAYHGDDGKVFFGDVQGQGKAYGPTFTLNDVVGCGVNFSNGTSFFTKNGVLLGNAFKEIRHSKLYPSVGMKKHPGAHLRINFGQSPFVYDIDEMVKGERLAVEKEINATKVDHLHPPLDETALVQRLVAHFLAHDGYVESARAFAEEVRAESNALQSGKDNPLEGLEIEDDFDATNRQKIRAAILDGDIDQALKHTNAYYADVLQANPQIVFRLKCRKFVELARRCSELQNKPSEKPVKSINGQSRNTVGDVFDNEMELDDQTNDSEDWMDTEESDNNAKYQELLQETMDYGQILQREYRDEPSREYKKTLEDTFSLMAYDDAKSSIHGHLLEPSGRVPVAEELNSVILLSLGKAPSAALERMYQQTEYLIGEISEEGGPGAFINVRDNFVS